MASRIVSTRGPPILDQKFCYVGQRDSYVNQRTFCIGEKTSISATGPPSAIGGPPLSIRGSPAFIRGHHISPRRLEGPLLQPAGFLCQQECWSEGLLSGKRACAG